MATELKNFSCVTKYQVIYRETAMEKLKSNKYLIYKMYLLICYINYTLILFIEGSILLYNLEGSVSCNLHNGDH